MSELPELQPGDLGNLVDSLFAGDAARRRSHLVAVLGTGAPGLVRTQVGEFTVVPVRSEIELRRQLPPLDLDPAEALEIRQVFLIPWDELPLDISGRFAGHGRVLTLPRVSLLRARLGVEEVDASVLECRLADYLLRCAPRIRLPGMGRLTESLLWQAWLAAEWHTPADLNMPEMLVWAASDGRGPQFVAAMATRDAEGVRDELMRLLGRQLGALGPILWRAWERGQGRDLLAFAVICEALAGSEAPEVRTWIELVGKGPLGTTDPQLLNEAGDQLRGRVALALGKLEETDEVAVADVLRRAEALVQSNSPDRIRPHMIGSPRLETSWNLRLEALGGALLTLLQRRDPAALTEVGERLRALAAHERIKKLDAAALARQGEMAARLATWLIDRSDRRLAESPSSHAPVESLARWYTEEGGYIDRARRAARPAAVRPDRFGQAVKGVLKEADEARRELDVRFAGALVDWYRAGRPDTRVLPIDKAVDRFIVEFLKGATTRRMMVLLLDGMAWAQAVELLESLGERATPWAPIAWMARRVGEGPFPPVLAGVPTVTDVSRAAFFAGKPMPAGKDHRTTDDPDRWQKHSGLKRLLPGAQGPRLFLGAEGHLRDGSLAPSVREYIERKDERVVALVLNAIDESLKSDPQQEHTWNVESIRSLSHLLDAARASGRVVVLASDHGHVAGDQLHRPDKVNREDSSRWRHLDAAGFDSKHEVAFTGEHVWYDRGKQGVVLLADDQHSYSSRRTWGAHGGATLAEVVAPLLVLGWDGMDREVPEDDAARTYGLRQVHRPSWWHLDIRPPDDSDGRRGKAKPPKGRPRPEPETDPTLLLPGLLPPEPPKPPEPAPPAENVSPAPTPTSARAAESDAPLSPLTQKLAKSVDFKAMAGASKHRDQVLQAVDYLARRQGVAPTSAFADALGIPAWRVTQTIARYTELLNLDGEPILQVDLRAQQVRLDIIRLTAAFGLEK